MYYTVYKTTNKINGKIYIGCHKTKDLDDGYIGSGKYLKRAIDKYGIENFEKEIIAVFDKASDMFEMESELVNEDFVKDGANYNLNVGGNGGWEYVNANSLGVLLQEQRKINTEFDINAAKKSKIKKRELFENDPVWRTKYIKNLSKGAKIYYINGGVNGFKNKTHTDETKRKISEANKKMKGDKNSQYGSMWICNIELQENKKIRKDSPIPEGWIKGRKMFK